jgi:hypothetical protein
MPMATVVTTATVVTAAMPVRLVNVKAMGASWGGEKPR